MGGGEPGNVVEGVHDQEDVGVSLGEHRRDMEPAGTRGHPPVDPLEAVSEAELAQLCELAPLPRRRRRMAAGPTDRTGDAAGTDEAGCRRPNHDVRRGCLLYTSDAAD